MIRILQCVNDMHRAGLETMLMNYYRNIDRSEIQFDFLTHRPNRSDYDDEIESLGGKVYYAPRLYPQNYLSYFKYMKEFYATHTEYKIVHGGLVDATIYGINQATGEYIAFLDPDDYIGPLYLWDLLSQMDDDIDFVASGFYRNNNGQFIPVILSEDSKIVGDQFQKLREHYLLDGKIDFSDKIFISRWNKLYRANVVKTVAAPFFNYREVTLGEDSIFTSSKEEMKEMYFSFLKGIRTDKTFVDDFWKQNQNKIKEWYLNQKRKDDVIISASPEFLLKPICEILGVENLIATKVELSSGKFLSKNCHGAEKVIRFKEAFSEMEIDAFYSDSRSDTYMAKLATKAFLVKKNSIMNWEQG